MEKYLNWDVISIKKIELYSRFGIWISFVL